MKYCLQVFALGMALFSMFFGGGNLVFPLWIGTQSTSISLSSIGFIISGVMLPFFGIAITLYFKGNYEKYLSVWGKTFGFILIFALLLFWIPLGSGPRCNQLAYGAFCQIGGNLPLWIYSAIYSVIVYFLTFKKSRILEILGRVITPILIVALMFLIFSLFHTPPRAAQVVNPSDFTSAFFAGYNTMDFIAAIFFSATIIALIKEKHKNNFNMKFVRNACFVAIALLSVIYVGMISVGYAFSSELASVPRDQLLAVIGGHLFSEQFRGVVFVVITLSVLSTSMALSLVFSDYLRKFLKISHELALLISVFISFIMSIIGFERLATLITYAMATLYPLLLVVTTYAILKAVMVRKSLAATEEINS